MRRKDLFSYEPPKYKYDPETGMGRVPEPPNPDYNAFMWKLVIAAIIFIFIAVIAGWHVIT